MPDGSIVPALAFPSIPDVAPSTGRDTALIAACAQFDAAERQFLAVFDRPDRTDADEDAASNTAPEEQWPLLQQIEANPPTTLPGFIAVAQSLNLWDRELLKASVDTHTTGPALTAILVRGLLAASTPAADADLLGLCGEFLAIHADCEDKGAGPNAIADDDAFEVFNNAAADRMSDLVSRMMAVPPSTEAGVQAVLRCLAEHCGEMAYSFDLPGTVPHQLLRLVLEGVRRQAMPALPHPDADLLAMRPEFERMLAEYNRVEVEDVTEEDLSATSEAFDDFCLEISLMPAPVTSEGRAFQAVAALHQLSYVMTNNDAQDGTGGAGAAWRVLAGLVGDAFPLPQPAVDPDLTELREADADADAPLLALKPELEKLHEELQAALEKNPARGGKKATRRKFDELVARAIAMPPPGRRTACSSGRP